MRVKLIRAASVRDAMAEAHRLLGPDSLILSNRRTESGVELTVAADPESPPSHDEWRTALDFHKIPRRIVTAWADQAPQAALSGAFRFGPTGFTRPLILAGPPGAGKTTMAVKLAARLVRQGIRPTLVNADQNRAGASAQLAALARVMRARFIDIGGSGKKTESLHPSACASNPVIIDLPGMDPFDRHQMDQLRAMIDGIGGEAALVLPVGLDAGDSAEIAERFHAAGTLTLFPTRLDLSRRLGGMVAAAHSVPFLLSDAGTSSHLVHGIEPLTPGYLAARLLDYQRQDDAAHAA